MALSDPVADFLTRIRNGSTAKLRYVDIGWSKLKENIASILKQYGFIENFLVKVEDNKRGTIRVFLKYSNSRSSVIQGLKRVSRPGLRKYVKHNDIPMFYGGLGLAIVSTSQGVMAGSEATEKKIGGELLCMVW